MPLYDFSCRDCHHQFEVLVRNEAEQKSVTCPICLGSQVERLISLPARPVSTVSAGGSGSCGEGPPCGASWCQRKG